MTNEELLKIVKEDMPELSSGFFDNKLLRKIAEVKSFIIAAGVPESAINEETAGIISVGVSDLFDASGGEAHFSDYFKMRLVQLAAGVDKDVQTK